MNKIKVLMIALLFVFIPTVMAEEVTTTSKASVVTSTTRTSYSSTTKSSRTTSYYDDDDDYDLDDLEDEFNNITSTYNNVDLGKNAKVRNNESSGYKYFVDDDADILTDSEEEELLKTLELCSEFGNAGFVSVSVQTSNPNKYAQDWYHSNFGTTSGTIFMINMKIRQLSVFSDGKNYNIITTNKAESIVSNVYRYATNGNYYGCANNAFKQIYTLLSGKQIFEPMKMMSNIFISITIATFICYIYVLSTSSIKKAKGKELFNGIEKSVAISNINIVKTGTKRVYSPQSDSSSGGGGGGGGGGGSSGGGASHGF